MKNYTITERQEIYEHLVSIDCPDLLAALIANRVDKKSIDSDYLDKSDLASWIMWSFVWVETPEDFDFWAAMHDSIFMEYDFTDFDTEYTAPTVAEAIDSTTLEMYNRHTQEPLSFWTRVKLFLGRWIYKV